jgi:hypothetical protein
MHLSTAFLMSLYTVNFQMALARASEVVAHYYTALSMAYAGRPNCGKKSFPVLYKSSDYDLFTDGDGILVFFYVDDIILLSRKERAKQATKLKANLMARYEMRDLGPVQWFLGIRVTRDREQCTVYLCQDSYIDKVANRYHLTNWKAPTTTPLPTEELVPYELKATLQEIHAYQGKVGSLQFTATVTRPDTAYAASKLAEFLTNPGPQQIAAVGQALTYLYATRYLAIAYAPPEPESTSAGQGDF